ncbi:MAG: M15 family metallopeptidase [Mycobacteriaceae bacterium]
MVPCTPASAAPAAASATVHLVSAADLGTTWRAGCPVAPTALRRVELDYLGFDGGTHRGQLVVNEEVVDDVIAIFNDLTRLRYPIEKMRTVEHYPGAEDELSMRDNNTSAFNCRILGDGWSLHAYGRAIDINPLVNPYIDSAGDLQPTTAARYLDRRRDDLGLLHSGDAAVRAFTSRGWRWGGDWHNPIDYQHFETD